MNKLKPWSFFLTIIYLTLVLAKSIDREFQNNLQLINYSFLTPKILKHTEIRPRRWTDASSEVHVSIGNWILKTQFNNHLLVASNFTISWVSLNASMIPTPMAQENCEALHGQVQDNDNSLVIMTICGDNFYVFFQLGNRSFAVHPTTNGSHILQESKLEMTNDMESNNSKKVKRDSSMHIIKKLYNLTGDTFNLDEDIGPTNVEREPDEYQHGDSKSLNYFSERMWIRSELPKKTATTAEMGTSHPARWLELGIAVDYSVIDFHGERVQQYVLALLNIVSAIYKDPSLEANLTLVITRMVFYVEKKDGMVRQGNARKSLENVNKWNRQVLSSSNESHDVAVWLTRLDIGGPSGYAPVSGACDPSRSCALNRDEGLTSAFIIAHELAHILGLTHDGDETANNSCGREASMGSVMAPMVAATFHRFHWSSCSKEEFHHRAKKWKCLNNSPDVDNATHLKAILHDTFTMDEQCRMEFGEGYELCRSFDLPGLCSHLWCGHKSAHQVCKTKKGPPLEGTPCGKDKWCVNGYCEPIDRSIFQLGPLMNNPRDGGWNEWSSWSKCSTSCGIGVRLRFRQCSNPRPSYGGSDCKGSSKDFAICEQSRCSSMTDLRREQCAQLSNLVGVDKISGKYRMAWLPHEMDDESLKCRLTCRNAETGRVYISNDFLLDGTLCSYSSTNICIQGKCYPMGCDHILNSGKRLDTCGICDGDNSTCISISNKFQRKIRRANIRVARVPPLSFDVSVEVEMIPSPLRSESIKLVLRDGRRRKFDVTNFESDGNGSILIIEGTAFKVQKIHDVYRIWGRGPTLAEVVISLKVSQYEVKRGSTVFVNFRCITDRGEENETSTYSWSLGGWSPCSVTCGGGVRHRTTACKNDQTGRIENRKKCTLATKPLQGVEKCNTFSCQFKWIAGPWEGCTKTCGVHGIQQRQIYCMHSSFSDNEVTTDNENVVYRLMLPPNICKKHSQPENQRACNKTPCRGNWIFTDWSSCTRSCGRGVQSRMARCVPPEGESLFDCDGTSTPDELRPCRGHGRRYSGCETFCRRDKSHYCIVPSLKKYCRIPGFQRHCCRACLQEKT